MAKRFQLIQKNRHVQRVKNPFNLPCQKIQGVRDMKTRRYYGWTKALEELKVEPPKKLPRWVRKAWEQLGDTRPLIPVNQGHQRRYSELEDGFALSMQRIVLLNAVHFSDSMQRASVVRARRLGLSAAKARRFFAVGILAHERCHGYLNSLPSQYWRYPSIRGIPYRKRQACIRLMSLENDARYVCHYFAGNPTNIVKAAYRLSARKSIRLAAEEEFFVSVLGLVCIAECCANFRNAALRCLKCLPPSYVHWLYTVYHDLQ